MPNSALNWRRKWQPTPVFLPGKPHGQRSLVGYSPRGRKELDIPERCSAAAMPVLRANYNLALLEIRSRKAGNGFLETKIKVSAEVSSCWRPRKRIPFLVFLGFWTLPAFDNQHMNHFIVISPSLTMTPLPPFPLCYTLVITLVLM